MSAYLADSCSEIDGRTGSTMQRVCISSKLNDQMDAAAAAWSTSPSIQQGRRHCHPWLPSPSPVDGGGMDARSLDPICSDPKPRHRRCPDPPMSASILAASILWPGLSSLVTMNKGSRRAGREYVVVRGGGSGGARVAHGNGVCERGEMRNTCAMGRERDWC